MGVDTRYSKFLSFVLRHKPDELGITLDEAGWVDVRVLLEATALKGYLFTPELLDRIVREDQKQRYSFNEDRTKIRANQGHSVLVDLGLRPTAPPPILFHGTVDRFLDSIRAQGLLRGQRQHVHLSGDQDTASRVGSRRGEPVVLHVRAFEMHRDGLEFFISDNGVWLTEHVPSRYVEFP
jgi:putative RNA 2'-phosphotransferase